MRNRDAVSYNVQIQTVGVEDTPLSTATGKGEERRVNFLQILDDMGERVGQRPTQ